MQYCVILTLRVKYLGQRMVHWKQQKEAGKTAGLKLKHLTVGHVLPLLSGEVLATSRAFLE